MTHYKVTADPFDPASETLLSCRQGDDGAWEVLTRDGSWQPSAEPLRYLYLGEAGLWSVDDVEKHLGGRHDQSTHGNWAAGSAGDPVHTSDVNVAVRALAEGRYVELNQVREVSTLLDKMAGIVADAKAKGEQAPTYNLCKVSIKGTNLFCAEHKGISRIRMPQLKGVPATGSRADKLPKNKDGEVDLASHFVEHLQSKGIKVTDTTERADYLRASQNELLGNKVAGMVKAIEAGKLTDKPIFISRESYVVDGHHRWAANVGVDAEEGKLGDIKMSVHRIDMPILEVLAEANSFTAEWGVGGKGLYKRQKVGK